MLSGSFSPAFGLEGGLKDLDLISTAARGSGVPDGLLRAVLEAYAEASRTGHGDDDMACSCSR